MDISYSKASPYYSTRTYGNFLDVWTPRPITKLLSDVPFTLTEVYKYRPDLLAFDLYQDSRLWWVFASRNPNAIKDPLFDFIPGLTIYVPKKQTLIENLGL